MQDNRCPAIKDATLDQFLLGKVATVTTAKPTPAKAKKPAVKASPSSDVAAKLAEVKPKKNAVKSKAVKPATPRVTKKSIKNTTLGGGSGNADMETGFKPLLADCFYNTTLISPIRCSQNTWPTSLAAGGWDTSCTRIWATPST